MSKNNKKHEENKNNLDSFIKGTIDFYREKQKVVNVVLIAIAVLAILLATYFSFYKPSREEKAGQAIFKAEQYFAMDSLNLALHGDEFYDGLLTVIDNYGFTKTGNRAKYIAGICYLKLGEYDNAVKYLKKFKSRDRLVSIQALGSIGDAYMELNDVDNARKYYKKAVSKKGHEWVTPVYLFRLGMLCEMQGNWKDAVKYYEQLQQEYPQSYEAMDIDKRIEYSKTKAASN
ncbi:MAG: tetratricopeptide repeat protein [Bacteroidales bacterium]|nr:tetratricopeptide repeat protein [Bacteroidales bacterium]